MTLLLKDSTNLALSCSVNDFSALHQTTKVAQLRVATLTSCYYVNVVTSPELSSSVSTVTTVVIKSFVKLRCHTGLKHRVYPACGGFFWSS